ncbi:MAG: hypothetical protein ABT20_09500 [Rubrivivax sp. SCN 70-15]|nr:MAG: hypothetical protein ABT20_09500 [Rubrivivax sp. SCN 70-15]
MSSAASKAGCVPVARSSTTSAPLTGATTSIRCSCAAASSPAGSGCPAAAIACATSASSGRLSSVCSCVACAVEGCAPAAPGRPGSGTLMRSRDSVRYRSGRA